MNKFLPHYCCSILKASCSSCERLWEFSAVENSTYPFLKQPFPWRPSMTSSKTRQQSRCNKMPLCVQQLSRYPYKIPPLIEAVIFVPPIWSCPITRVRLQAHTVWKCFLCHMKCYQKLSQYLGILECNVWFSTASCIRVITMCIAVSVDFPGI